MKKINRNSDIESTETLVLQYNLWQIILMFLWPCIWFAVLIYLIAPMFLSNGNLPTWLFFTTWMLGNGAELIVALVILKKEGYKLTLSSLKSRIRFFWPKRLKTWIFIILVFIAGFIVASFFGEFNDDVARLLPPMNYMPGNPLEEAPATMQEAYPDIRLAGNYGFLVIRFIFLGFIFNMIGEELYYRSVLMPKMKAVFGKWDWVANGVGFGLKHLYFYWRLPALIPAGIAFALLFKIGGLPIVIITHWIANMEIIELIQAFKAVLGF